MPFLHRENSLFRSKNSVRKCLLWIGFMGLLGWRIALLLKVMEFIFISIRKIKGVSRKLNISQGNIIASSMSPPLNFWLDFNMGTARQPTCSILILLKLKIGLNQDSCSSTIREIKSSQNGSARPNHLDLRAVHLAGKSSQPHPSMKTTSLIV